MKRVGHEDVYDRQKELKMEENYMAKTRNRSLCSNID
jgi:hypothetical protein